MTPIYACLSISDFAAASLQRPSGGQRVLRDAPRPPLAVFTGKAPHRMVFCANAAARAGGVHVGMPLAEASARFADRFPGQVLVTRERDNAAEEQTWRSALEMALTVSPRIEDTAPGQLLADLAGLPDPHRSARALLRGAEALGLPGNVGVSMNRFVAECAACTQEGVTHVFPGQESAFLHVLPVSHLPLEESAQQTLVRWGIRTMGAFAALPDKEVTERLGTRGAHWLRMARGQHQTLFLAHAEEEEFTAQTNFDWQVADLEPLAFTLSDLLGRLCQRLQHKGLAVGKLRVALKLASGNWHERELLLPTAHTDTNTFVTLARLELSAHPPGEPIEGLRVTIEPAPRRTAQGSLFEPVQPSPEKLDVTLARLHNLVSGSAGAGSTASTEPERRVGAPEVPDTHRYDASAMHPYAPPKPSALPLHRAGQRRQPAPAAPAPITLRMALRCLRPAPEAEVRIARAKPVHVSARGLCHGAVDRAAGPWRLGSEWWTDSAWDFEEWDVAIGCQIYRIRCELPDLLWRVAGIYD
ncbi:MAG: DNA polymerase Y family protein [Bryobacterales bacterium]|nr:DNA polymerase Y family protein [Bryobacterales bacterium]